MPFPDTQKITAYLTTQHLGRRIVCVDKVESTNTLAKSIAREGAEHGTLVICAKQTQGRGRRGRSWQSDDYGSLCMSVILYPRISNELMARYIPAVALAVSRALWSIGVECTIKWPNDILVNGKKLCGINAESAFCGDNCSFVVCGIGMNVNTHFESSKDEYLTENDPSDIGDYTKTATSVCDVLGHEVERETLAAYVVNEIECALVRCESENDYIELLSEYAKYSCVLNREVELHDGVKVLKGVALRLDDLGRLVIGTQDGEFCADAGDVSLRIS